MDIARYFMERSVTSWMVTLILLVGGALAFMDLGRLEDPEFSIKSAQVLTQYPGATPEQVEQEVTYLLERELQNMPYVDQITSTSTAGLSKLSVKLKDTVPGDTLNQVWDELRKKVRDLDSQLPPAAKTPLVVDDFSDVYGILYALAPEQEGEFNYSEMKDIANDIAKELALVDGVAKVVVSGTQQERIEIEIPRNTLVSLGIPAGQIASLLSEQNLVSNAGSVVIGQQSVRLQPTGEFNSIEELGLLTVINPQNGQSFKLMDIAEIRHAYKTPSTHLIHFNGKQALAVGVSFLPGVNVVDVGEQVRQQLSAYQYLLPVGIDMEPIYFQSDEVAKSVDNFMKSLMQAIGIVIVVLLVFMGFKSGLLIGLILAITIFGTFIVMNFFDMNLQRISLGGLIIALGMLVDNAIVVTEGILIGLKRGKTRVQAASDVVKQTKWPLAGATVIAITAFAPIGLSPDSIGEFVGSLFWVLLISLSISWFTAVTLTPFFCSLFFKEQIQSDDEEEADPYSGIIFTAYKSILSWAMTHRWQTIFVLVIALMAALVGFREVKQAFFPASNTPMFFIELRQPSGTSLAHSEAQLLELERWLVDDERVQSVTATLANGLPRFLLTYSAVERGPENTQLVVRTHQTLDIDALIQETSEFVQEKLPDVQLTQRKLQLGPGGGAKLEVRLSGDDATVLRQLSDQVQSIYRAHPNLTGVRDNWKQPVKVLQPVFDAQKASELGITKKDYDEALLNHLQGKSVGRFRDSTEQLPIVITVPQSERERVEQILDIQLFANGRYVNIGEVTEQIDVIWENPVIERRDRQRTLTVMADPALDSPLNANQLFGLVRSDIEALALPAGYELEFGGEYESSSDAKANMISLAPMGYLFMFIITVLLFNSIKETLVVWFCIPLMMIGISAGLLMLDIAFGFMGFLGLLSLSGMVVKNGIVLIDQVKVELQSGKDHFDAMFDAAVSRVRPVAMAALTTILGLMPLLFDPFFQDMAVVISFGLGFATLLTLVAVPVFYVTFHPRK